MDHTIEITNLIVGIFLILIGILIKHAKMYFLIAGYNTMSEERKRHFNIEGFSTLFRNCFVLMGVLIFAGQYLLFWMGWDQGPMWIVTISVGSIIPYLIIRGKKYDHTKKKNLKHDSKN